MGEEHGDEGMGGQNADDLAEKGDDVEDLEGDVKTPPRIMGGSTWCCATTARRWTCGFLVVMALLAVIVIPLVIYVIVPKLAQSLNTSTIQLTALDISNPTETSATLSLTGQVSNTGILTSRVVFADGLELWYMGNRIKPLDMTPNTVIALTSTVPTTVSATSTLSAFLSDALALETLELHLRGSAAITLAGVTVGGAIVDKRVAFKGFDSLRNASLRSFSFATPATNSTSLALFATVFYSNPSPISLDCGTLPLDLDLSVNGTRIGTAQTVGVRLVRGENTIEVKGSVFAGGEMAGERERVERTTELVLAGRATTLTLTGASGPLYTVAQPSLSWIRTAFAGLAVDLTVPARDKLQAVQGLDVPLVTLVFDPANPWQPRLSSQGVVMNMQLPSSSIFSNVTAMSMNISVFPVASRTPGNETSIPIGTLTTGWIPAASKFSLDGMGANVTADLEEVGIVDQQTAFAELIKAVFAGSGRVRVPISLQADAVVGTSAGTVSFSKLPYLGDFSWQGLEGLVSSAPTMQLLAVTGGTETYLEMQITIKVTNPSNLALVIYSDVVLQLVYSGQVIGTVTVAKMNLTRGENILVGALRYIPITETAKKIGGPLVASFLNGDASSVTVQGFTASTMLAPLVPLLSSVTLPVTLPGMNVKASLIANLRTNTVAFAFDRNNQWTPKMTFLGMVADLKLPFALPLTMKTVDLTIRLLSGSSVMGVMQTGPIPTTSTFTGTNGTMTFDLNTVAVDVAQSQQSLFTDFMRSLIFAVGAVSLPISLEATAAIAAVGADVALTKIPFSTSLALQGMQGFASALETLQSVTIVGGSTEYLDIRITAKVKFQQLTYA
ncbi:hypothetical protein HDU93_007705 [Gonapodya sp. JEL0774]|nr:hypothetical protein HDU93_007705 [Gonapodya sp. JEL0774]